MLNTLISVTHTGAILAVASVPTAAPSGSASAWALWVPVLAMIAAVVVLGMILAIGFSRRERQLRTLTAQIRSDLEEARAIRTQLDEAHALASNMMVSAQRLSARLDERITALDLASLRMNATRNALPRPHVQQPGAHSRTQRVESTTDGVCVTAQATSRAPHATRPAPAQDALTMRVYELASAGMSSVDIARELGEHHGKIDLILALRPAHQVVSA